MEGLNENAVDFMDTYDGEEQEPVVMPAAVPNLLCNGSAGIAVGMATNIPPHNLGEVADALLYLIKNPECEIADLVKFVKGPDFPTGGLIIADQKAIIDAYTFGKGYFRIRAKWEKEDLGKGQYQIVVTEIPYQVIKSKLIEKSRSCWKTKNCRCWRTCAMNRRMTCGLCWSRRTVRLTRTF